MSDAQLGEPNVQQAITQIIKAESTKARAFVPHMLSLGQLRETIFRRVLIECLPKKVSTDTGLITNYEFDLYEQKFQQRYSKQIDILLHDHFNHAPVYQLDGFIVTNLKAALAGIEVKSHLDKAAFADMLAVHTSIRDLSRHPTVEGFGYALSGVNFESFRKYISDTFTEPEFWKHDLATFPMAMRPTRD